MRDGARTLYLLTTVAEPFFRRLGYVAAERSAARDRRQCHQDDAGGRSFGHSRFSGKLRTSQELSTVI